MAALELQVSPRDTWRALRTHPDAWFKFTLVCLWDRFLSKASAQNRAPDCAPLRPVPITRSCEVISFEPLSTPTAALRSKIRVRAKLAPWRPLRKTAARAWQRRTALYGPQQRA